MDFGIINLYKIFLIILVKTVQTSKHAAFHWRTFEYLQKKYAILLKRNIWTLIFLQVFWSIEKIGECLFQNKYFQKAYRYRDQLPSKKVSMASIFRFIWGNVDLWNTWVLGVTHKKRIACFFSINYFLEQIN